MSLFDQRALDELAPLSDQLEASQPPARLAWAQLHWFAGHRERAIALALDTSAELIFLYIVDVDFLGLATVACGGYLLLRRKRRVLLLLLVSTVGALLVVLLLKGVFARPRPEFSSGTSHMITASFPSGHSMLSAVVYLTLGALLARATSRYRFKLYFLTVALVLTALVGLSRVYLGVHYPTDVLAGWSFGLAWALLCWLVARFLQMRGAIESPDESD
jgi:undecaprenyl-diphosphatase